MAYFILHSSEDGFHTEEVSKEELLERVSDPDYYGRVEICTEMPEKSDPNYWGSKLVIIKGKVVVPHAKKVVTEYEVD
jgi:hypothetical protein